MSYGSIDTQANTGNIANGGDHVKTFNKNPGKQWWRIGAAAIALLWAHIPLSYASSPDTSIQLTPGEKTWLSAHPVIRIGVDAAYAPYSFKADDGVYRGIALDYMAKIERLLGVRFEILPDLSWPQILQGAKDHSLDAIATAVQTPERDTFLGFSRIYIPTPLVIMSRLDEENIQGPADLTGKRVALVEKYSSSQRLMREYPAIEPYAVETPLEGLNAVASRAADAYVGVIGVNTYLMSKHGITNLKVAAGYEMRANGQRFAVRKDWREFPAILDKALATIPEQERLAILTKWIPVQGRQTTQTSTQLLLTDEEKNWLAAHKQIRLAVDPEFAPVEFIDAQGNFAGIAADYVKLLNQRLGISMRVVDGLSWSEAIDRAKRGEIDVFSAITPTGNRRQYLNFTEPYFKYPIVIFTRDDHPFVAGLESLVAQEIAVVKDYVTHELVPLYYPEADLLVVDNILEGLTAVSTGKAEAFIGDTATTTYIIRKHNITNIKLASPTEMKSAGHSFAVRKDWPVFATILDKALQTISPQEQLDISKKWIEIEIGEFHRHWIWIAASTAGLLLVFIILSSILRTQVRRRTAELSLKNEQLEREAIERQRMEEALKQSERRLAQFFHGTFEMVFFHDNGKILDVNPAAKKVTGYETEELIGNNILNFVAPKSQQTVLINMASGGEGPFEIDIMTKNGRNMPVEIHAKNIEINGYQARVVSLRDITERKKNQAALQRAHDNLEIKIEERTRELVNANIKLKELDHLKSMFIASVSHELRTPLNSIIGFSSMMMRSSFGSLDEKYIDYSTRINRSGQHLLALITDIIDLSKIESGRIDTIVVDFILGELIAEAVEAVHQQAQAKNMHIEVSAPKELSLHTDRRRLLQCLLNFLSNAVKYSEQGRITIVAEDKTETVKLSVKDTGIGISEQDIPRLFDAFERIDSHLRVKAGGTGLGLYLTKKIARDLLKGNVGVESKQGSGSVFWIQIPKELTTQQSTRQST